LIGEQWARIAKGIPKEDAAQFAERKKRIEALLKQASDARLSWTWGISASFTCDRQAHIGSLISVQ